MATSHKLSSPLGEIDFSGNFNNVDKRFAENRIESVCARAIVSTIQQLWLLLISYLML